MRLARQIVLSVLVCLPAMNASSQKIATLVVELSKPAAGLEIPVSLDLNDITYLSDSLLALYEVKGSSGTEVPFQIEQGLSRRIHWLVAGSDRPGTTRTYELVQGKAARSEILEIKTDDGILTISEGNKNLLGYVFKTVYPPAGIDSAYRRSGFIHPLRAPHGQVLTRIQPPDHYHHYGIWNPWTHVEYEGDTIDFWNLNSKQGTVRFAGFVSTDEGPVYGEFEALHEHVVFGRDRGNKVAMNELQNVRVFRLQKDQNAYIIDFNIHLNPAGDSPFRILEYRYAGLGWRTTEKWDRNNSMVLTSEGRTRKDADGTKARWCIVQGAMDDDYAGIVMMSFPTNYNYPEPLRIWPDNMNNRGDMFANFSPTKDMDWLLNPRQNYFLRYRFLVFNGPVDKNKAESAWNYFAYPPKITVIKENKLPGADPINP